MANIARLFSVLVGIVILLIMLVPNHSNCSYLKKKEIKALKKVAIVATVLGNKKKIMIPLPVPLPIPIPIVQSREPIISPIDPLLTLALAKGSKGLGYGGGGFGGIHGGLGGFGYGKRR